MSQLNTELTAALLNHNSLDLNIMCDGDSCREHRGIHTTGVLNNHWPAITLIRKTIYTKYWHNYYSSYHFYLDWAIL